MSEASWQAQLAASFTRIEDLFDFLDLPPRDLEAGRLAAGRFPFRVTRSYAARMQPGDPADPLLRQVLPAADELVGRPGFVADPVGDLQAVVAPGVLHKYYGRVLVVATGACAIHCRYCFRREFPYGDSQLSRQREDEALAHIAADSTITEVILSGGDPLVLSDERLRVLVDKIAAIAHVKRLRIHTRLPVVLPSRVTPELVRMLADARLRALVVIHANHARELDGEVNAALTALRLAGVVLLNQSVLLKGVNDAEHALVDLSETLFAQGVLPYYLHVLDPATGTGHFDLPLAHALALHDELRRRLPGYLVPKLVREVAGKPYKTWL
jgi:EF-P beta-lysylation protein EpmB